jgi:hypothetical protein
VESCIIYRSAAAESTENLAGLVKIGLKFTANFIWEKAEEQLSGIELNDLKAVLKEHRSRRKGCSVEKRNALYNSNLRMSITFFPLFLFYEIFFYQPS